MRRRGVRSRTHGLDGVVEPLGWLPYAKTGELYRTCHVGLSSMLTPHPSYLPFELMACGALVVALSNPANAWLLEDGASCLTADATAFSLAATLFRAVTAWDELAPIRANAARTVARVAGRGWAAELADVVAFMTRPAQAGETAGRAATPDAGDAQGRDARRPAGRTSLRPATA